MIKGILHEGQMYDFACISAYNGRASLRINICYISHIHLQHYMFGCNLSIIRVTLNNDQYTFSPVSLLPWEGLFSQFTPRTQSTFATNFQNLLLLLNN
jgi:hypothetical protein